MNLYVGIYCFFGSYKRKSSYTCQHFCMYLALFKILDLLMKILCWQIAKKIFGQFFWEETSTKKKMGNFLKAYLRKAVNFSKNPQKWWFMQYYMHLGVHFHHLKLLNTLKSSLIDKLRNLFLFESIFGKFSENFVSCIRYLFDTKMKNR